jgi:hypothetical protein
VESIVRIRYEVPAERRVALGLGTDTPDERVLVEELAAVNGTDPGAAVRVTAVRLVPTGSGPVTVDMLRGDWEDRPDLSDEDAAALQALDDATVQAALDEAFKRTGYQSLWWQILDETRGDATRALLDQLGRDSSNT